MVTGINPINIESNDDNLIELDPSDNSETTGNYTIRITDLVVELVSSFRCWSINFENEEELNAFVNRVRNGAKFHEILQGFVITLGWNGKIIDYTNA